MYVVFSDMPCKRLDADRCLVSSEWAYAVKLLRDSLDGRFGKMLLAAPEVRPDLPELGRGGFLQPPVEVSEKADDIGFYSLGRCHLRPREYWREARAIRARCRDAAAKASVVHSGINDAFLPWAPTGHDEGVRQGKMTVFVIDTDIILQSQQLSEGAGFKQRMTQKLYRYLYYRTAKRCVSTANLALLKGQALMQRFGALAHDARTFYDTSHQASDIVNADRLEARLATLADDRSLRLLSLGRLTPRKGVDHTIRAVAKARREGAKVKLDIIGAGEQEPELRELVESESAGDYIKMLGQRPFGAELLSDLATYDLFIFTPLGEDTPRAAFDAFCGGLPMVSYEIPYTRELSREANQPTPVSIGATDDLAATLLRLDRDRAALAEASRHAVEMAKINTLEAWYEKRAAWTLEAFARYKASRSAA
jgi:glycosyltransferase involved in cell wall biosynthesis